MGDDIPYREEEIQALIALGELDDPIETENNNFYRANPESLEQACTYFRRFAVDLGEAFDSLARRGLALCQDEAWHLTPSGRQAARQARHMRPPIWYWYKDFYIAVEHSHTFSRYCERVYGKDLSQHGFSDLEELHWMLELVKLDETTHVLDIGCGTGKISEYVSDLTGARVTGIDYMPEAVAQARRRTADKQERLTFEVRHIDDLDRMSGRFDAILAIDSIFFGQDLTVTLANLKRLIKPGGEMFVFCGEELAAACQQNQLGFTAYDRSREHHRHLQLKRKAGMPLKAAFEAEGNLFVWENIMAESLDTRTAFDPANCSRRRYLYHIRVQPIPGNEPIRTVGRRTGSEP